MVTPNWSKIAFLLCIICEHTAVAQITGNLNVKDPRAIAITDEQVGFLTSGKWNFLEIVETRNESLDKTTFRTSSIEFTRDGIYREYADRGTWRVVNRQFVEISLAQPDPHRSLLGGPYSIYEISDSTLVLAKVLTSTGNWRKEYRFSNKPRPQSPYVYPCKNDSIRDGKTVKYYPDGKIEAIEYYGTAKEKITHEILFRNNYKLPDCFDKKDSSRTVSIKTGEWTRYFSNGQVRSTSFYDNDGVSVGEWRTYLEDGRIGEKIFPKKNIRDVYRYRDGNLVPFIERQINSSWVYVIGNRDSIEFDRISFHETALAGSFADKSLHAKNLTGSPVELTVLPNSMLGIAQTIVTLQAYDTATLTIRFKIPAGQVNEKILIKSSEWVFETMLSSFGYHLTPADFGTGVNKKLTRKFFIHRASEEFQLEIVSSRKMSKPYTVPISKQMNEIELGKGRYRLTLVGPSGRKSLDVEVTD